MKIQWLDLYIILKLNVESGLRMLHEPIHCDLLNKSWSVLMQASRYHKRIKSRLEITYSDSFKKFNWNKEVSIFFGSIFQEWKALLDTTLNVVNVSFRQPYSINYFNSQGFFNLSIIPRQLHFSHRYVSFWHYFICKFCKDYLEVPVALKTFP